MFSSKVQHYLGRTVAICIKILLAAFFIRFFLFTHGRVEGASMEPTLKNGQTFFVNEAVFLFRQPRRYEIVDAFDPVDKNKLIVKRIIGLPGEKIIFKENTVFIQPPNGAEFALQESYLPKNIINLPEPDKAEIVIPPSSYFIAGDNRQWSHDSRFYGPVQRSLINGKVMGF